MKKLCIFCNTEFEANGTCRKFCCANCRSKNWASNNKHYLLKASRSWRKRHPGYLGPKRQAVVDRVDAMKATTPCHDCGRLYPSCCMDFDHKHGTKQAEVGVLVACTATWERIEAEIEKCDLVCANCHRIRTKGAGSKGWTRKTMVLDDDLRMLC